MSLTAEQGNIAGTRTDVTANVNENEEISNAARYGPDGAVQAAGGQHARREGRIAHLGETGVPGKDQARHG